MNAIVVMAEVRVKRILTVNPPVRTCRGMIARSWFRFPLLRLCGTGSEYRLLERKYNVQGKDAPIRRTFNNIICFQYLIQFKRTVRTELSASNFNLQFFSYPTYAE